MASLLTRGASASLRASVAVTRISGPCWTRLQPTRPNLARWANGQAAAPKTSNATAKSRSFHGHMSGGNAGVGNGEQSFGKSGVAFAGAKEMRGTQIMKVMVEYVWPKDKNIRRTVVMALGLLVGAKLLNISVPFFFKHAVDQLNAVTGLHLNMDSPQTAAATAVFALLIGYGIARAGSSACNELRNAVFARVAQHSIRKIAQNVFRHLHNLDLVSHGGKGILARFYDGLFLTVSVP
jgi:hypothetical protein